MKFVVKGVWMEEDVSIIRDILALGNGIPFAENSVIRIRQTSTGAPLPLVLKAIDSSKRHHEGWCPEDGCLRLKIQEFVLEPRIIQCLKRLQYGHNHARQTLKTALIVRARVTLQAYCQAETNGLSLKYRHCLENQTANSATCSKRQENRRQIASDPRFAGSLLAKKIQAELREQTTLGTFSKPALNYPRPPPTRTATKLVPASLPARPAWGFAPASQVAAVPSAPSTRSLPATFPSPKITSAADPVVVAAPVPVVAAPVPVVAVARELADRDTVLKNIMQHLQDIFLALQAFGISLPSFLTPSAPFTTHRTSPINS